MKAHPYADAWPLLHEEELAELAADIAANGLRDPIVVYKDTILDGRNRFAACEAAGIEPTFETFTGTDDDALAFVQSVNNARRHQSKGSLAASWALSMLAAGKRRDGQWVYGSRKSVDLRTTDENERRRCGVIADHIPALLLAVRDDEIALHAAYQQACDIRDEERNRLAEEERITAEEADALAALPEDWRAKVGDVYSSARVAFAAWEDANRAEAARMRRAKQEAEKRAEEERAARVDLHTQVLTAAAKAAAFGGYEDMSVLLDGYNAADLPRHVVRDFTPESLTHARRFIDYLTEWQGANA